MSEAVRMVSTMTVDEWAALDDDVPGELVDGVLVEEEDVGALHESIVAFFARVAGNWLAGRGRVLTSDTRFAISETRGRKPDLTVYFDRARLPARRVVRTPPDVAVEILSPTARDRHRDRVEKRVDYVGFGVRFYWVVDPEARTMEVLAREPDGTYASALVATRGRAAIPGCEGLVLDLDAMWAELEGLVDDDGG